MDQKPRPLNAPQPKFPEAAKRMGREGVVVLEFTVDVDGKAADIVVIKEEPKGFGFDEAAIEAIKKWRFTPAKRGDENVPMRVRQTIRFSLND